MNLVEKTLSCRKCGEVNPKRKRGPYSPDGKMIINHVEGEWCPKCNEILGICHSSAGRIAAGMQATVPMTEIKVPISFDGEDQFFHAKRKHKRA